MKKPFTLLCGTIALICLVSMFMPIVAPRYSAQFYHPSGDYTRDYFFDEDYYCAREYWSISKFALSNSGHMQHITLSAAMALMLYWSTLCFMGENSLLAGRIASILNLGVTGWFVVKMLGMSGGCRPVVIAVILIDAATAVVCALLASPGKK